MIKLWSICRNTFVQTVRQPIFTVLIGLTCALLVLNLALSGWTMGSGQAQYKETDQLNLENLGLATLLMSGLLIAAFSASNVLTRELEDRTALTVVSKPVSRAVFLLGKFLGVTGAVALAFYVCSLVFFLTARHHVIVAASDPVNMPVIVFGVGAGVLSVLAAAAGNYFLGWPFTSVVIYAAACLLTLALTALCFLGPQWQLVPFWPGLRPVLFSGLLLVFMGVLVLCAVAVAVSVRFGQVMTLLLCGAVLLIGLIHPFLFDRYAGEVALARIGGWVAPNLKLFETFEVLTQDRGIPPDYIALAALYCLAYVAAVLAIGIALFQLRALEAPEAPPSIPGPVAALTWLGRAGAVLAIALAIEGALAFLTDRLVAENAFTPVALIAVNDFLGIDGPPVLALLPLAGVLVFGVALWMLWTHFGRGHGWAYWVVLLAGAVKGVWLAAAAFLPQARVLWAARMGPLALGLSAAAAGVVVILLVLPKTRHHFRAV